MKIIWFGTASVAIESENTKILFDPFFRMNSKLPEIEAVAYFGYDAILLTHGHVDHLLDVPKILHKDRRVPVYCTAAPRFTLRRKGVSSDRIRVIAPENRFTVGDFKITAKKGKHVRFDIPYIAASTGPCFKSPFKAAWLISTGVTLPENGEILIYEVSCEGKTVTVMGSFGFDKNTEYTPEPDVFVLPYNGSSRIPSIADAFLAELRPKSILFDHFDDSIPPLTRRMDVEMYEKRLNRDYPDIKTIIPDEGAEYEV